MPSHLIPQNPDFLKEWIEEATATRRVVPIRIGSPYQGMVPDLDPNVAPVSGFSSIVGLIARPDPNSNGEVLTADAGFGRLDPDNLPIVTGTGSHTAVTMLGSFNRTTNAGAKTAGTEYDGPTLLALVGGDGATAGSAELWRLKPSDGTWEQVPYSANGAAAQESMASQDFLSDWAEFPAGAPGRTADSGAISEPVFVWCNLIDRVMVYPVDDGVVAGIEDGAFEPLSDRFSDDFRAATVEHFGGRLYFGNTIEGGVQHRQRIRRTSLFTANVLETLPGAGAFDIRDFSGDLLRLEKLGDVMAAYFTDGVAFVRTTDVATAPDGTQLLREKRGLLSTHSVVSVGNQEHFGVFDDGWFFLDPSGRWTEAGLTEIDGVLVPKWKETFYQLIDMTQRERTVVDYDGRYVRIAFTAKGDTDNQQVWIFDPRGNRVFQDRYPVVCWGSTDGQIRAATAWEDMVGSWDDGQTGSWASQGAVFGLKALHHGTPDGYVLSHNYDLATRFMSGAQLSDEHPTFQVAGVLSSGGDSTLVKRALKLWVEQIHSGTESVVMGFSGDSGEGQESGSVDFSAFGSVGDINTVFRTFNFSSTNLRFFLIGTSPVRIRSIRANIEISAREERNI